MSRRTLTPREQIHADWLGMLRPEGLVVSVPVLLEADAYVRQAPEVQAALRALCPGERIPDRAAFGRLLAEICGWPPERMAGAAELERLAVALPDLGVELRPDGALLDREGRALLFIGWTDGGLDEPAGESRWPISRHQRFERLLLESQGGAGAGREAGTGTAIGLSGSPEEIRLTYAPRGEAPGSLTFPVDALCAWDGRVLVDALLMLIGRERLFTVPQDRRLGALLEQSRKRQEQVTVALAGQVEEALGLLLAGADLADRRLRGGLYREMEDSAAEVREGLVSALLRLVFLLYCEDSGVLPMEHPLYLESYSLGRLVEKLEEERVLYPEAMRHRYGAWARLCALFRLVHGGIRHGDLVLPPRHGELFHPDRHPWLEGRVSAQAAPGEPPPVDDGVVLDVLERLVYLENQRLSYRNLDVEQIGSVYEALMALEVRRCRGRAVPVRGGGWLELWEALEADQPIQVIGRATGLPEREILRRAPALARFRARGDRAADEAALLGAMGPLVAEDRKARDPGQHVLVGGAERRHTGSHYTPTSLTRPIVIRTLGPVLGESPAVAKILETKVCDPAMGSGAFLAEACRYLAARLLDAWIREQKLPPAEQGDPLLAARRLVAERCLYGVDKNPFAVQLARLSLWLVTLAKDQPFTFVDHCLREGDSVIGLDGRQIAAFDFGPEARQANLFNSHINRSIKDAVRDRARIVEPAALFDWRDEHRWKAQYLKHAREAVELARERGDLLIAQAWRPLKGKAALDLYKRARTAADATMLSGGDSPLTGEARDLLAGLEQAKLRPFHWELEFPEVFARGNPGFDAIVGNPPFGGKNTILASGGDRMIELHRFLRPHAHGNADLCAWFFLRAASILRTGGCFGLVATNTIKQGDTRATGLQHLVTDQAVSLYDATTDLPWPVLGGAAVVVDVVHGCVRRVLDGQRLNGQPVRGINSGLTAGDELPDPVALQANAGKSFIGSYVLGTGFLLDPSEAQALIDADPANAEVVRPYIGGEELNNNPPGRDGMVEYSRYVINFGDRSLEQAERWPELMRIVRERVKPQRDNDKRPARRDRWWQFAERSPALYATIRPLRRCLVIARVSKHHMFAFQPTDRVYSDMLIVVALDDWFSFAVLQSRVHEAWARGAGLASTLGMGNRYTPSTVFETFPFPRPSEAQRAAAGAAGAALDGQRTLCMRRFGEGMTGIWNRLHDPDEDDPEIVRLRAVRAEMDRAVLAAYGWEEVAAEDTGEIVRRLRALNVRYAAGRG